MTFFPEGLRETALESLPLSGLLDHDAGIEDRLFKCCQKQGFFYLDLTESPRGKLLLAAADRLHELADEAFRLPVATKDKVSFANTGTLFGWKPPGVVSSHDIHKRKDVGQFFNISKDDILNNPGCTGIAYPSPLKEEVEKAGQLQKFVDGAHSIGLMILECLEEKLELPRGELTLRHRITELAGDHVRMTWGPGDPNATGASGRDEASTRITTAPHTDFGSVTLLFNWLGGLQIENHETGEWEWVRPRPGHAICNLGDAMVKFSGSQLRSGKHRVVAAPGEQAKLERYSIVYFVRPEDQADLEVLTKVDMSTGPSDGMKKWKAGDWIIHRAQQLGNKILD